jgi:hypothetical protein
LVCELVRANTSIEAIEGLSAQLPSQITVFTGKTRGTGTSIVSSLDRLVAYTFRFTIECVGAFAHHGRYVAEYSSD